MFKNPFDEAMDWDWEAMGNGDPAGRDPGLYVNGRHIWGQVGDRLAIAAVCALGKDALAIILAGEFKATDKDGYACCQECGVRKATNKHALSCKSGALCERYRVQRRSEERRVGKECQ